LNIVKNNQSIAKEVVQNQGHDAENLTNYYNNDCKGNVRERVQYTTLVPPTEQPKSAIRANKIAAIVLSAATPSPFQLVAYANRGELGRIPNESPVVSRPPN